MEAPATFLPYGVWPLLAAAISAAFTAVAIRYAHRRALIDQPGHRRSHREPTPRGGGIGIVLAALAVLGALAGAGAWPAAPALALLLGLLAVAAIGWCDDHRALPAWPKLAVHLLAALGLVLAALAAAGSLARPDGVTVLLAAALVLAVVWSINLHNFMDGINGLLAWQATFVLAALGTVGAAWMPPGAAWACLAVAAAALAFLPFNFPRARVFMGDVGSGALGFLIAAAALPDTRGRLWLLLLLLDSAFIVDTLATLAVRVVRGRRWYSAHREHLYQWLVRSGLGHARVVGLYALWNLSIVLPCALMFVRWSDARNPTAPLWAAGPALGWAAVALLPGLLAWGWGKRWCLARARAVGQSHAA